MNASKIPAPLPDLVSKARKMVMVLCFIFKIIVSFHPQPNSPVWFLKFKLAPHPRRRTLKRLGSVDPIYYSRTTPEKVVLQFEDIDPGETSGGSNKRSLAPRLLNLRFREKKRRFLQLSRGERERESEVSN